MTTPRAQRIRSPRAALALAIALAVFAAACKDTTSNSSTCNNQRFDLERPTGTKMLAFAIAPKTIVYHYLDIRRDTTELTWDTSQVYYGGACLRFQTTDSVRIDSAGAFQLVMSGSNSTYMRRRVVSQGNTVSDSVVGYVFFGCEGDGGTFRLRPDSTVTLAWTNGQQERIFGPAAIHRLAGDTLWSSLALSSNADSVRGNLRFGWRRAYCGEGF
jgi:hypothetical protein